jgi:hypothetical protein
MSTRSIVAVWDTPAGDSLQWKGRYVHSDGYPAWTGEQIRLIGRRDGAEVAARVLTQDRTEWSQLASGTTAADAVRGKVAVPGYGLAYSDASGHWYTRDGDTGGCEWAYVIGRAGVTPYQRLGGAWFPHTTVGWHDGPDAMNALQRRIYPRSRV